MSKVTFDKAKFYGVLNKIAVDAFTEVGDNMQTFITQEKREYPRTTVRVKGAGLTGKVATSPRDVVDTGKLRDSFQLSVKPEGKKVKAKATWTTDYVDLIYAGTSKQPPYPWVHLALRETNWKDIWRQR